MMSPNVSVILSTFNAYERLKNCLYSLTLQEYPLSSMEVIVIDDGSVDLTEDYMKNAKFPFPVIYERNVTNLGRSYTRNKGIELSSGNVLIFSDCDMILPPRFVQSHMNYHSQDENIVVCGAFWHQIPLSAPLSHESIKNQNYQCASHEQPWADWFKQFVEYYGKNLNSFYFPWMYFVVMNVSVRKEHVLNAGFFDEAFRGYGGEDEELGYRLYKRGLSFLVDTNLKNYHQEHKRPATESTESQSNIQHILEIHPNVDTLLFYRFHEFSHNYKNEVVKELHQLHHTHHAVASELEHRFVYLTKNGSRAEMIELFRFSKQYPCPLFSNLVKKKCKQRRNFK